MPLGDLSRTPTPVLEAGALLSRLDEAFVGGFARLSDSGLETLESLARAFGATPLAQPLRAAVSGIARSELLEPHFLALASARAALQGARHDALLEQACAALGRGVPQLEPLEAQRLQAPPPHWAVWLESTRQWLTELALAGFGGLGHETLLPFHATLEQLRSEPALVRPSALLEGFLDELLALPTGRGKPGGGPAGRAGVPLTRWTELWSRAMVLAAQPPVPQSSRPVSGELRLLAADLRQHETFVSFAAYGVLDETGAAQRRIVRCSLSAFKVDVLRGQELASVLQPIGARLLEAFTGSRLVHVEGMPLLPTHDLLWQDERARPGAKFSPAEEAAAVLASAPAYRPCLEPADRHPALLEELVVLQGYTVAPEQDAPLELDGASLPVAYGRWPSSEDLAPDDLGGSRRLVGLLRFDAGRWSVQPLLIERGKKRPRFLGSSLIVPAKPPKNAALPVLRERASRLLRKKS
jgi:hypothetical protein